MDQDNVIGQRIAALREAKGLSQAALAKKVGIKQPSLWAIEKGHSKDLKHETVVKLADALAITTDALMSPEPTSSLTLIEEAELSLIFRRLTKEDQGHLIATARAYRDRMVPTKRKTEAAAAAGATPEGPAPAGAAAAAPATAAPPSAPRRTDAADRAEPSPSRARKTRA